MRDKKKAEEMDEQTKEMIKQMEPLKMIDQLNEEIIQSQQERLKK